MGLQCCDMCDESPKRVRGSNNEYIYRKSQTRETILADVVDMVGKAMFGEADRPETKLQSKLKKESFFVTTDSLRKKVSTRYFLDTNKIEPQSTDNERIVEPVHLSEEQWAQF